MIQTATDHAGPLLAQARQFSNEVWLWLGVIVALAIVLGVAASLLRRKLFQQGPDQTIGFTLADIRRLHAEGQLSDAEFEQAKARMLAESRALYAGDNDQAAHSGAGGKADAGPADSAIGDDSSTGFAPPDDSGAENRPDDPDKNADGGAGR